MCSLLSRIKLLFYNEHKIKRHFPLRNRPLITLVVFISENIATFCNNFNEYNICLGKYQINTLVSFFSRENNYHDDIDTCI